MRTKLFVVCAPPANRSRLSLSLLALIVSVTPAMSQSSFSDPEAASPYGGDAVTVGELAAGGAASPLNSLPAICPGPPSPSCVLTGQYNRGRQGQNSYEPTLAGYGSGVPNKFTNINYYTTDSTDYYSSSGFTYNPIMAQPASVTPADFFTPYTPNFLNDLNGTFPAGHSATATKVQALGRYDLDFGTAGVLLFGTSLGSGTQTWAVTADKTGYVYSMPTLTSGTGSAGLGQFQSGDAGLTSGSFTTQAPFQLSRKPPLTGTSTTVCPYPTSTDATHFSGGDCHQIMELAYWNNSTNQYLFAWPEMETLIAAKGTGTSGSPTNYTFSTTYIDPCSGSIYCTNFPQAVYPGGNMAVAANSTTSATLWVSFINNATSTGELRGYSINPGSTPFFTKIYDPSIQTTNKGNCSGLPTLPASYIPSSFAEPTLVNGMVFAPVFKAKTSTGAIISGGGVLVYGTCS